MGREPKFRALRGMPDILPGDSARMWWMEVRARDVFRSFGFSEIKTPILEETQVFTRSIGEDTDIVEKEMYSFTDRGGKRISLRPEGTASVIRAYIESLCGVSSDIVKLFYSGPMFRGERPQKGRLRQFHQMGVEMIGGKSPYIDAELIICLDALLKNLEVQGFTILLNSLGCKKDRDAYTAELGRYLITAEKDLCENCRRRSRNNVLRVLDCKRPECSEIVRGAPEVTGYLCDPCSEQYGTLKRLLEDSGISYSEKPDLVRGLDYYTGIVFEAVHPGLGAQDAIAAGGRYDGLTAQMGGPDTGATGFAVGVERLMLLIDSTSPDTFVPVVVIPVEDKYRPDALKLTTKFRLLGIACEMDHSGRSLKAQMRKANKEGRRFVAMLGDSEIKNEMILLKDMSEGGQRELSAEAATEIIRTAIGVSA